MVVGSGAGGATAAVTLARGGASVIVVEAGAWRDPQDYPSTSYGAVRDMMDRWSTTIVRGRAQWPVVQASAVGGTTTVNSAICVRTPAGIFRQWEQEHGFGGDALAETFWAHQEALEAELSVEEVPDAALGRSNSLALQADQALGYEGHRMRRYVKGCQGSGQCIQGCKNLRKQSMNITFIPEVRERGGHVLSCAPVDRVIFEGRRAVGVQGRFRHPATRRKGGRFTVRARRAVVVSASATYSPVLLMKSGVRSPALGNFFRAHPGAGVFGVYDDPVDMTIGATQGWATTAFRDSPGVKLETLAMPLDMIAGRFRGGGRELMARVSEYRHMAMWCHAVRAESVGTVRVGLFGGPVVRYTLGEADMHRFRAGTALLARAHFAAGARRVIPGVYGLPYALGPDEVHRLDDGPLDPRAYVGILSHLFGGCAMGTDPSRSVVDPTGHVHGYQGLVVADASVLPTVLGVNPQHTIMAMARHTAGRLVETSAAEPVRARVLDPAG